MTAVTWTEQIRLHVEPCKRMPGRMWDEYQMVEWGYQDRADLGPMVERDNQSSYLVEIPGSGRYDTVHGRIFDAYHITVHLDQPRIPQDILYLYRNGRLNLKDGFSDAMIRMLQMYERVTNAAFDVISTWAMSAEFDRIEAKFIDMQEV